MAKKLLLSLSTFIFAFVLFEIILRAFGLQPDLIFPSEIDNLPDSFGYHNSYISDQHGIMVFNKEEPWDFHVNSSGFRSREFDPAPQDRISVFFIGDSFTFGSTAKPLDNCFVDLVEKAGYHTYNAGFPGTDPAQYLEVAKTYLRTAKPDFCFLMFFEGDDIVGCKRKIIPYKPLYFNTDYGSMSGYKPPEYAGQVMEPFPNFQAAYDYYFVNNTLSSKNSLLAKICGKTVISTGLYNAVILKQGKYYDESISHYYIQAIDSICRSNDIVFYLLPITSISNFRNDPYEIRERNPEVYGAYPIHVPSSLKESDYYNLPHDTHLNNDGHRKYADLIIRILKSSQ